MKESLVFVSFVGAAIFASSGAAAELAPEQPSRLAPTTSTADMLSDYLERHADHVSGPSLSHTSGASVSIAASQVGDAQAQARSILSSTPPDLMKVPERVASSH